MRPAEENDIIRNEEIIHKPKPSRRTPLPKLQLFIVFLIQATEPLTATVIYPFVNQFVRDTGIVGGDERRTGYYAGIIGSAFFFAEALTVFHWGWLSDRVGRRPILLVGPFGLGLAMFSFGLSNNFWRLFLSRCVQGIFNGNIGVSKTVMAELTDSTNMADAFAVLPLTWSLGSTIGPIFGGLLAEPAKRWPTLFGRIEFFVQHPYFLPCAAAGLVALTSGLIGFVKLKETLPSALEPKWNRKDVASETARLLGDDDNDDVESYGTSDGSTVTILSPEQCNNGSIIKTTNNPTEKAPPIRSLLIPQVLIPVGVYAYQAFIDMSNQVLLPLMYSTSIPVGGLGMEPYHIGVILSVFGCCNAATQLTILPRLIRKMGPRKVNAIAQVGYISALGLFPLLKVLAQRAGRVDGMVWGVIVVQLMFRLTNGMGYGSIQILIVDSAPSKASLGATNGLAQAMGCVARSVGPSIASSLFSVSLQRNLVGGNLVYIVLVGCAILSLRLTSLLPSKLRSQS